MRWTCGQFGGDEYGWGAGGCCADGYRNNGRRSVGWGCSGSGWRSVVAWLAGGIAAGAIEYAPRNDQAHDFVAAFQYLVHAGVAQQALDRVLADVAVAAVQLQRLVADGKADVGGKALGHRAIGAGV